MTRKQCIWLAQWIVTAIYKSQDKTVNMEDIADLIKESYPNNDAITEPLSSVPCATCSEHPGIAETGGRLWKWCHGGYAAMNDICTEATSGAWRDDPRAAVREWNELQEQNNG